MSTVYLHIGTPKTGTTALQNFLPANEDILQRHGICYPDLGYRYPNLGIHRNAAFLTATIRDENGNRLPEAEKQRRIEGLDQVAELAEKFPKIILSDEGIWKGSTLIPDFWTELKNELNIRNLDLKIIVYFRRQDLWVQSHWAQKIKEGATYNFHEYLKDPVFLEYPLDYYEYMNKLADIFGKDALIIRVYEKEQYEGEDHTIHSDFLNIFGLKMSEGFIVQQQVYNTSLEGDYLEMKRILNALPEFKKNSHSLIRNMKSIQDQKIFPFNYEKKTFFAPGEQEKFLKAYEAGNAGIARDYLGREDGVLFYNKVKELPQYTVDTEQLLKDTILSYGKMFDKTEKENQKLKEELRELKAEFKSFKKESQQELKKQVKGIQEDLIWFRLKRKTKHILGRDKAE